MYKDFVAHHEIILHEGQVPPAAVEPGGAVIENDFEDGFLAAPEFFEAQGDDFTASGAGFIEGEFGNGAEMAAVLVAAGRVQEEVTDGKELEPGELLGAFAADAPEGIHRCRERRQGGRGGRFSGRRHPGTIAVMFCGFNGKRIGKVQGSDRRGLWVGYFWRPSDIAKCERAF